MRRQQLLVFVILVSVLVLAGFALTRDHWWFRVHLRTVIQQGSQRRIQLWRSATGNLLVENNHQLYFVSPQDKYIGVPNSSELTSFAAIAFTRHGPPLCVDMPSVKVETKPNLVTGGGLLAFNRMDGSRIELRY